MTRAGDGDKLEFNGVTVMAPGDKQEVGSRKQEVGSRKQEVGSKQEVGRILDHDIDTMNDEQQLLTL